MLTNGNELHGTIENEEGDPLYLILPKGRIAIGRDMIAEWRFDTQDFQDLYPGRPSGGGDAVALPTIALRGTPSSDEEFEERYTALMDALTPLVTKPEQALPSDMQMKDVFISAVGALGDRAIPRLEATLEEGDPRMAATMLKALGEVDAAKGADAASGLVRTHFDPEVRRESVALLADSARADRDALLEEAASDDVWYVRSAAYEAMLDDWTTESLDKAVAGLEDSDPDVRDIVKSALEEGSGESFETVDEWRAWIAEEDAAAEEAAASEAPAVESTEVPAPESP